MLRAELHFLDLVGVLMLLGFLVLLGLFVAELAEIHDAADRRRRRSGAISTRSTPLARARFRASLSERTPSCLPSTPMTRTSRARIFPLTLTNEAEEEEERGGKGRLKTPSSVETYSCRLYNGHSSCLTIYA